jgi:hypothetical protein
MLLSKIPIYFSSIKNKPSGKKVSPILGQVLKDWPASSPAIKAPYVTVINIEHEKVKNNEEWKMPIFS